MQRSGMASLVSREQLKTHEEVGETSNCQNEGLACSQVTGSVLLIVIMLWSTSTRCFSATAVLRRTLWSSFVLIWSNGIDTPSLTSVQVACLLGRSSRSSFLMLLSSVTLEWLCCLRSFS